MPIEGKSGDNRTIMSVRHIHRVFASSSLILVLGIAVCAGQETSRKILVRVAPDYPDILRSKDIVGTVRLRVVISPSGTVRSAELVGGNPILGEAAVKAIKKWHYEPSSQETTTEVQFRFNLH